MACTPTSEDIQRVRNKTTDNIVTLSDAKITEFLVDNDCDTDLAIADSLEFLAASQPFKSVSRGGITQSNPTYMERAALYRRRADLALEDSVRRNEIQIEKMVRTDVGPENTVEYGF